MLWDSDFKHGSAVHVRCVQARDDKFVPCKNSRELYNQLLYLSEGSCLCPSLPVEELSSEPWRNMSGAHPQTTEAISIFHI